MTGNNNDLSKGDVVAILMLALLAGLLFFSQTGVSFGWYPQSEVNWALVSLLGLALCSLIGAAFGRKKGREGAGALFGALLGPVGWALILIGPDLSDAAQAPVTTSTTPTTTMPTSDSKKCPDCAENVKAEARKCRFCGFLFNDAGASV